MKVNDPRITPETLWEWIMENIDWVDKPERSKYQENYWKILESFGYKNNPNGENKERVRDFLPRIKTSELYQINIKLQKLIYEKQ